MSDNIGGPLSEAAAALLPYKTARELLAEKPPGLIAVGPQDSVLSALRLLAEHNFGLLVVLEGTRLVGVMSERDYARKVVLQGRASSDVPVRDIMTANVVHVTPEHTVSQCMALMDRGQFRHLPVVEGDRVLGVLSVQDILKEIIAHHARLITRFEIERTSLLNQSGSY